MKRLPLTQGKFALVDDEDYGFLSQWKWYASASRQKPVCRPFYAVRHGPGSDRIYMHREILQPGDGLEVDHVNGDGLDNRRVNLRAVTHGTNLANQTHQSRNRKYDLPTGVYHHGRKFQAMIGIGGHRWHLGTYDTPEEASAAYQAARDKRIADDLACLNPAALVTGDRSLDYGD